LKKTCQPTGRVAAGEDGAVGAARATGGLAGAIEPETNVATRTIAARMPTNLPIESAIRPVAA